jgi:hypothetical protein
VLDKMIQKATKGLTPGVSFNCTTSYINIECIASL